VKIRRLIGPAAALALLAVVGAGIWYSNDQVRREHSPAQSAHIVIAHGLVGSEKQEYLADPRVEQALARHGLSLSVHDAGSREIAARTDPAHDDFGFPSGAPAAAVLKARVHAADTFSPFYTPIVIATWKPIAKILETSHVAHAEAGGDYYTLDLQGLLALIQAHKRWKDLPGSEAFATSKAVLIRSTDVRTSNSAAMYLSLASYVSNHLAIVQSQSEVDAVLPVVAQLFLAQGIQGSSSAEPFQDYLALGMGNSPMLVAYESQMVSFWLAHPEQIHGDMVMMYPQPTVYSRHEIVPCDETGRQVGAAFAQDPALQGLAHEHGFRTGGDIKGPEVWEKRGIHVPATLIDVVDPPAQEWLESMIKGIERQFP
jgi:hypothetical protein